MAEPSIEGPIEDWIEQQAPGDPDEEAAAMPESTANTAANEADVLEQYGDIPDPGDNYPGIDAEADRFPEA